MLLPPRWERDREKRGWGKRGGVGGGGERGRGEGGRGGGGRGGEGGGEGGENPVELLSVNTRNYEESLRRYRNKRPSYYTISLI